MRRTVIALALAAVLAPSAARAALNQDDFYIHNAQDLVDLCAAPTGDPLYREAIHFCEGFLSGAWQYHMAETAGPQGQRFVCPPDPPPTRDQVVAMFVTWSGQHPQRMLEPAVDALFRFAAEKWPCPEETPPPQRPSKKKGGAK